MKIKYTYEQYPNRPWLTVLSMLQSSLGFFLAISIGLIPGIICVATGTTGPILGGLFAGGIILSIIVWVLFACFVNLDEIYDGATKNTSTSTPVANTPNTKSNISQKFAEVFYERVDYIWSKRGPACYQNVKMREAFLKDFLYQKHEQLLSLPQYQQNPHTFQSFAFLQCFALSFVIALSLEDRFEGYSSEDVSLAMIEVMSEFYLSEDDDFESCVPLMIMESSNIVRLTLESLEGQ